MTRIVDFILHSAAVVLIPVIMTQAWAFVTTGGHIKACGCSVMPGPEGAIFTTACNAHQQAADERRTRLRLAHEKSQLALAVADSH
ncbi:MAG: hypothetical protein JWN70_4402 [Planctomycetaceae bacterium]|nr:hypothetical protein [Planctomycetaceae bacterium]